MLRERLHLMMSLYDLFYTEPAGRIMQMSTLDSNFQTRRNVWIRDCWEEFQIGVIAHFEKFHGLKTFTDEVLETLQQPCFPNETIRLRARDQALWMSIEKTPDWIYSKHACVSPFPSFVVSGLKGEDKPYRAFYVDGQPGTGKSQMLLYLIHRLMKQIPKMAIYYVLPDIPIFTILVDRSDPDNPISVQFHITSLYEDWCTSGFPTIRIVDSFQIFDLSHETYDGSAQQSGLSAIRNHIALTIRPYSVPILFIEDNAGTLFFCVIGRHNQKWHSKRKTNPI
ncbi:hypothetical protein BLNAU_24655 [Blattamonas nauphoetae]|uniref:NACHT domain-containing protein n=1 Tax=Blattamonas nauphoetae TaxID=2049346 RepID=A0ABQ9WLU3_9EUKA|nr:hypothetical protein BLNAU_24655 [Blattamonas nauphoetae]